MNSVDLAKEGWTSAGETTNARFFLVDSQILAAIPRAGATDDERTAIENRDFQVEHFRRAGSSGVVIVLIDGFVSQDKGARRVYQEMESPHVRAIALVASSLLGRAIASFSMGMKKAKAPVKFFATIDDALAWARATASSASGQSMTIEERR